MTTTVQPNWSAIPANDTTPIATGVSHGDMVVSLLFNSLLMVTVLAGNGLIIGAFAFNYRLRTITNILVIGLSSADFLVGSVSIPCWIYIIVRQYNNETLHFYAYQFYITADIFIGTTSILHLTCISCERCHAVMKPIKHRLLSRKVCYCTVATAWTFSALIASLQPLQYRRWQNVYTLLTAIVCFFIPAAVIFVAYGCIFRRSRGSSRRVITRHCRASHAVFARELRLSLTVCLITVLFVAAWLPLFSLTMVATFNPAILPDQITSQRLMGFVKWMHYSSSAVNPFFYSYRNKDLRNTIKLMLSKLLMCKDVRLEDLYSRSRTNSVFSFRSSIRSSISFGASQAGRSSSHPLQRPPSSSSQISGNSENGRKRSEDENNNGDKNERAATGD